jgi:hypothetical protein
MLTSETTALRNANRQFRDANAALHAANTGLHAENVDLGNMVTGLPARVQDAARFLTSAL